MIAGGAGSDARVRFEGLVRDYGRLITSIVFRLGGQALEAVREDVEQEVLLALWKQIEREQEIRHPSSYVYRAAVRETVRVLKRERARRSASLDAAPAGRLQSPQVGPEREAVGREQAGAIEASLRELGQERERAVRAHLSGFDVAEIMRMFGWPYQKARNLVARGMSELRDALRRRGIDG